MSRYQNHHRAVWKLEDQWDSFLLGHTKSKRWDWAYLESYFEWVHSLICRVNDQHWPERDQCGMPEHDYCLGCGRPMPFAVRTKNEKSDN